jgi:acyl dehydratase
MIDYEKTKAWRSGPVRHAYTAKDTILYALGVGFGADPLDADELRYVYEKDLRAVPTLPAVLASPGPWMRERKELGIDFLKLVHGEESITLHAPLPTAATVIGESRVTRIVDKGEGKGAVMHVEKTLTNEADGRPLATVEMVLFLRGDGGFSRHGGGDEPAPPAPAMPEIETEPDLRLELPTRADAALLYRLSGDLNPLHAEPTVAAKAGFPRPILHGLATYGHACRGIVSKFCGYDGERLKSIRARLSSPVYPGETLVLDAWRLGGEEVAFRASVKERGVQVLANGRAVLSSIRFS